MDPVRNPFSPGAGTPPPELAGRREILSSALVSLQRCAVGRPAKSQILVGLRGVGKTVLLNQIHTLAQDECYYVIYIEAHENKPIAEMLAGPLRSALSYFSTFVGAKEAVKTAFRTLRAFMGVIKIGHDASGFEMSVGHHDGNGGTGDIEVDLPDLLLDVACAASAAGKPIVIIVDEMQYFSAKEFSALIMSIHRVNQKTLGGKHLPLMLFGAGLPQIYGLAGNSKSYAERLFTFSEVGPLGREAAMEAIVNPIQEEGEHIDSAAVDKIVEITQGYPYFIQQWSQDAWNVALASPIRLSDVEGASPVSIAQLDQGFFKVRFDRCTPSERRYMRALAELGPGAHKSGDVAEVLGVKSPSVAPVRDSLIKKGMVYAKGHGSVAFTVPLFDDYMKRVLPLSTKLPKK